MLKIKWTPQAEEQYLETLKFWIEHNHSTAYSEKLIDEVEHTEYLLLSNPQMGLIVKNTQDEVRRVLVLSNYSLYYRCKIDIIEVISFWANKMNPSDSKI